MAEQSSEHPNHRPDQESGFDSHDGTRLFYRVWSPTAASASRRALVFLHRGHEHSGRIQPLVEQFERPQDWAFAWDARGHGHSPGERGDAPDFQTLVQDFEAFVRHLETHHQIAPENLFIVANSVGAVIVATWLNDYGPRVRGVVMAAAAFDINLYVPLAKPALRLATGFKPDLVVSSYIRATMLTHCPEQARTYDHDPLIAKSISARVLLSLADTARRVVAEAAGVDTPILMLVADQDYVVKPAPQRAYFERLSSGLKRYVMIRQCHHAIFYEAKPQAHQAIEAAKAFATQCFAQALVPLKHYHQADTDSVSASRYQALQQDSGGHPLRNAFFALQKLMLGTVGQLSQGMAIGLKHGFDSGASLDYVYRNQPRGALLLGKSIDSGYLQAIGWRGIRQRKTHLQTALSELIKHQPKGQTIRILDIASGGGRYVLETVKRFHDWPIEITLRDFEQHNLDQAKALAQQLQLDLPIAYQRRDAFCEQSYPATEAAYDIVIVSGLYELFSDNARILTSLRGMQQQLKADAHLIYTNQPWHPQLELIAKTLNNHQGQAWTMRARPQAEMDALVASAGWRKLASQVGIAGIFTVSVARRAVATLDAAG